MSSTIKAAENPVLVDVDHGEMSRTIRVTYDNAYYPTEAYLWWRFSPDQWQKVAADDITPVSGSVPIDERGRLSIEMKPGQIYELVIYHSEDWDPNQSLSDPEPDAHLVLTGLKKGPEATDLLDNEEHGGGGTYFEAFVNTSNDTFGALYISDEEPVRNPDGILRFPNGPRVGQAFGDGLASNHELLVETENLKPGNDYHAVVQLNNAIGDWQYLHFPFTTRRRKTTVDYRWIHIVNDGANGRNKARFAVWLWDGRQVVASPSLGWREIWDRPTAGLTSLEWIDLHQGPDSTWTPDSWGPIAVDPSIRDGLWLLTRGLAKDTFGEDDPAGNFIPFGPEIVPGQPDSKARYSYPIGRNEAVIEDQHFVDARPLDGDEFRYSVEIWVTVEYE